MGNTGSMTSADELNEQYDADGSVTQVPERNDEVHAGESAVAGFAALKNLLANPEWKGRAGLTANARVLLISTEGATAPRVFERIVGRSHEAVALAQKEWLKQRAPDGFHGRSIA